VGTPVLLLAVSLALGRLWPGATSADAAASPLPCLALTFAAAAYPLAGVLMLRRSTDPMHPVAGGAALGAASGAAGGVIVSWWCPLSDATHVLLAHVLPVAMLAIVGAAAGDSVLAMRVTGRRCRVPRGRRDAWRIWKKGDIAKRFVSCDVTPVGDRVAGNCSRSMGVDGSEELAEEGIMTPDVRGTAASAGGRPLHGRAPGGR